MAERPPQPRGRNDFKIAIICALSLEAGTVRNVFDEERSNSFGKAHGDGNAYSIGIIGRHNVVLVHMPGMGSVDAATTAGCLRASFPNIAIVFVTGICGASPYNSTTKTDIVLGDCIVSTALVQYDFGRRYPGGQFSTKSDVEDALGRANPMIRAFLAKLQTPQTLNSLERRLALYLSILQQREPKASYPGSHRDRLFDATYIHTHSDATTCDMCIKEVGVCTRECDEIGCQQERSVIRARSTIQRGSEVGYLPRLHFGRYGSADTVLKSGTDRDELTKNKMIAFEMEGAGFWENMPTLVVKSACDYADSHKSKEWQNYAAATAAAGLKAILEEWEASDEPSGQAGNYDVPFELDGIPVAKKFVDRPEEMRKLETVLLPNDQNNRRKLFVLCGMGGIGKTQLAVEFMRNHHTDFTSILWLDGSSDDSLKQSIAKFANRIPPGQISDKSRMYISTGEGKIDTVIAEVMDWLKLSSNDRWLMIFDNVDREFNASNLRPLSYNVKDYFPGVDYGSILITTRLVQLERLGESQKVKRVDKATAKAILDSWHDSSYNNAKIEELLERLDGLPLALAQAGSYLHETGISIDTYLRLYDKQNERVAEAIDRSDVLDDYPNRSVWTTWNISYDAILTKDKYTANLLLLWSYLDRNDFWYGLFEGASRTHSLAEALSHRLGDIADQELSFIEAMTLLRSYSLVEGSDKGYIMHTVVHRWVYFYYGLKHQSDLGLLALKVIGRRIDGQVGHGNVIRLQQRLLPHANICSMRIMGTEKLQHQGDDNFFGQRISQEELEDCLRAIYYLGHLYHDSNKLCEAETMYTRALVGAEKALGLKHPSTLSYVAILGLLYTNQDKLDKAEPMLLRAAEGYEETLGPDDIDTLDTVNDLGKLYVMQGKYNQAEKVYAQALIREEKVIGPRSIFALHTTDALGMVHFNQGKLDKAELMYMRALVGFEELLGANHMFTLQTIYNLGLLYFKQRKLGEAEKMLLRALRGHEETLGAELLHTYTPALDTLKALGDLYSKTRIDKSRVMYERALAGYNKNQGPSADVCLTLERHLEMLKVTQSEKIPTGFKKLLQKMKR